MQSGDQSFPAATMSNHLFAMSRDRNRIEFIDDFPNQAEVISSLQIHPMGWCAVSRNVNAGENEEVRSSRFIIDFLCFYFIPTKIRRFKKFYPCVTFISFI